MARKEIASRTEELTFFHVSWEQGIVTSANLMNNIN